MAVNQGYLPDIRRLAMSGNVTYRTHCMERMLERSIGRNDVLNVLKSRTNEILEIQAPSNRSPNQRILVYDPKYNKDIIVVLVPLLSSANGPELRIVTVEFVDGSVWEDTGNAPPSIQRIK